MLNPQDKVLSAVYRIHPGLAPHPSHAGLRPLHSTVTSLPQALGAPGPLHMWFGCSSSPFAPSLLAWLPAMQVLVQGLHGRCLVLGLAQPALGIWLMGRCHSPPVCSAAPCSSLCSYHPQAAETGAENACVRRPSRELMPRPSLSSLPLPAPGGAVAVAHRGPAALAARWLRSLQHRHVSADLVLCLRPWRPWTTASPT